MSKVDAFQKQLEQWRVETDGEIEGEAFLPKLKRLPKDLRAPGYSLIGLDEQGRELPCSWEEPLKFEKAEKKLDAARARLDKMSAAHRRKIFACFAPKIADAVEKAWQYLKTTPYKIDYTCRPFRAAKDASVTLKSRIDWFSLFASSIAEFDTDVITLPWLAQWAPHAFHYQSDCVNPLLIVAMNQRSKLGDEIYEILHQSVTREHEIGIMGEHVIGSLMGSEREDGWALMEKTLLAAQRQEGLRQSIVQGAHVAHPKAFQRILKLIVDENLIRFSSVGRSINGWFGLLWDSVSAKVIQENVEAILQYIDSPAARKKAIASQDAETVYRGLWAMAFHDAPSAVPVAAKLLKHSSDEIRYVATWILSLLGTESSRRSIQVAIDDENLQIAMLAAVRFDRIAVTEEATWVFDGNDEERHNEDTFTRLENLYNRLPEKPKNLAPIVWPWTERKVDRKMVAGYMLAALGDRPPTKLLPYLKGFDSWQHRTVIELLSQQRRWDTLTRETLFDLAGHTSADVRNAAFEALDGKTVSLEERQKLEGYLSRTSADLRLSVVEVLTKGTISDRLASADRLVADGTRNRRLAGLEMLRQIAEGACEEESDAPAKIVKTGTAKKKAASRKRTSASRKSAALSGLELRAACQSRAAEYQAKRKKLTKDEQVQLEAIAASDREVFSLDNAFGLMDPEGRSKAVLPKKKKVLGISKAALGCLKDLDNLVHKHRKEIVKLKGWQGWYEKPLGEVSRYELPDLNLKKPLGPQREKFPLVKVWQEWKKERAAKLKDNDGLELLRAMLAVQLYYGYGLDEIRNWVKKPSQKKIAVAVLGELTAPKLRYEDLVGEIVEWLLYLEIPKGCVDFLLDCTENAHAHVPDDLHSRLLNSDNDDDDDYDEDEPESDWRRLDVFGAWWNQLSGFTRFTSIKLTKKQDQRIWELTRFLDEPIPGAMRNRMPLEYVLDSFQNGLATFDDITDVLLGPNRGRWGSGFDELSSVTQVSLNKEYRERIDKTKGLGQWLDQARERILEIELARGEAATVATNPALAMSSFVGTQTLMRIMSTMGREKFKVLRGWRADTSKSRLATLTALVANTYPADSDTPAQFAKQVKQAIQEGYCDETRLLELAFLAPQWTKFVEAYLKWDGFSEGLYWFIAHMSTWNTDAQQAAAGAEGLEDDESFDDDDDYMDDDDDEEESQTIKKPRKLSAWERLVIERTPLTASERQEGAVDVEWFHRTWDQLGAKRWQGMAHAAKFSANSSQARKAQFLADVLLGNAKKKDLVDGIKKRNLKDNVRLLGLLPLAKGSKRDNDVMDRYNVLQAYKKYARGLSSLTKPEAMRAVEIGFANLARLAGFRDPLRLEWSLEAESVKDLAKGPVAVTKDGVSVTLSLDESAKPQLAVRRGDKPLKSIPAAMKKKHAAIRDLADRGKELKAKASRMKQSLEQAMCRGDIFTGAELLDLMQHAILSPQLSRLVLVGENIMGYPDKGGKALRDYGGKLEPVRKNESLRIAHPCDLLDSKKWDRWQRDCFQTERMQPFKQIFRELYVVTKQEKKDGTKSSRFAGQQIGPRQAMALWNSRGWNTQDEVFKTFHERSLVAEVNFQWDYGTAAEIEGLTLETVHFRSRDEFRPQKLSLVPAAVFSEVMRDIDLVVSVAHRGEVDPEASASTVEMRATLINETCKLLGLKNVEIKKSHALIDGYYGEYSLHLGSGNVQRIPGGALAILPVYAQHRGRLFLPFADDDPRTAEVISKVLLLARDEEILDPMILDQLAVPVKSRKPIVTDDGKKSGATAKAKRSNKSKQQTSDAMQALKKRRYELSDGKSNKFWEITLSDTTVTTTWGRIDSKGQSKTKSFADEAAAQAEYDRLVKDKTKKGYGEV